MNNLKEHRINKARAMARDLRNSEGETQKRILAECKAFAVINARHREAAAIVHKAIEEITHARACWLQTFKDIENY